MRINNAYLSLGSNIGDRLGHLRKAVLLIDQMTGKVKKISSVYETEPWGVKEQEKFLNIALGLETRLDPAGLMENLLEIEKELGRVRTKKWQPRVIDIDILFFNDLVMNENNLVIPHMSIQERNFVLTPLAELCPGLIHPVLLKNITELQKLTTDPSEIIKTKKKIEF